MSELSISESVLLFVLAFGILQGILLAVVTLFYPRGDRSVNIFLALYIFSITLIMMLPIAIATIPWQQSFFHQPVPLLVGPFLYLYVSSFRKTITWKTAIPHFIPFILFFIPAYWNMALLSDKYPGASDIPSEALQNPLSILLTSIKLVQPTIYYFLSLNAVNRYERTVKQMFSEIGMVRISCARILINGFLLFIVVAIIMYAVILQSPEKFRLLFLINMVIGCPYIYIITYRGIAQPTIWLNKENTREEIAEELNEIEAIENSRGRGERKLLVDERKLLDVVSKLKKIMETDRLYLKTDLTVQDIAGPLQLPAYVVSQAINEQLKKNFYDLINGYRVEEAQRLLLDPKTEKYKILTIGIESGFNSKTTFNTVFKKFTGMTPTEFRDHQKATLAPSEP